MSSESSHTDWHFTYLAKQAGFLYTARWDEVADNRFTELLIDARTRGLFNVGGDTDDGVSFATDHLNFDSGAGFSYAECKERLQLLEKRYRVFKYVIRRHGVMYNAANNHVSAPTSVWIEIFRREPFAEAYEIYGDPCWANLQELFDGMDKDVRQACSASVEVLSSHDVRVTAFRPRRLRLPPAPREIVIIEDSEDVHVRDIAAEDRNPHVGEPTSSENSVNHHMCFSEASTHSRVSGTRPPGKLERKRDRNRVSPCKGSNDVRPEYM